MLSLLKQIRRDAAVLTVATLLAAALPISDAFAQTAAPAPTSTTLAETTIKALQEALNKQGIAVTASGVLGDETRAAIRTYQSQHHLPVTGEPDKATLDKLGVRQSAAPAQPQTLGQAAPPPAGNPPAQTASPSAPQTPTQPGQMQSSGMMMNCPMMQGQMPTMMPSMQGQMRPGQMQPGQMQQGQTQTDQMQQGQMPAMMQMMQGMMQMMQSMQGQMQPGQMQPGQMQQGQMRAMMQMMQGMMQMMQSMQGQMQPGQMQPSPR